VILLELAAQGVKGVAPPAGRFTLRPGYNVLASPDGAALARLVGALLAPAESDAGALPRAGGAPGGAQRAGATLAGSGQRTFRLVRDFARGAQLHRYDPAQRTFVAVAAELAGISEELLAAGAPARPRFEWLQIIDPADLPSRAPGPGLSRPAPAAPARRVLGPEDAARRLAELRDELERARAAERLQLQLDGLQTRGFQAEKLLEQGAQLGEAVERARAARGELERLAAALATLGDLEAKIAGHARAVEKRDEALSHVAAERAALEEEAVARAPRPLWRVPTFAGGVGVGLASLAAGVWGAFGGSSLRYLALCDVPAFGVAAAAALRAIGDLEVSERLGRRRALLDERERKAVEAYARDGAGLDRTLAALELKGSAGLREAAQRVADADRAAQAASEALAAWEALPETRGAQEEKARLAAEGAQVEKAIAAEAVGYLRDPRTVEAEISRVEAEQAAPAATAPAAPAPAPAAARASDPIAAFLREGANAAGETPPALLRSIGKRAAQFAGALSGGRLGAVLLDERGNLTAQAAGRMTPASGLPPADRDVLFVALKLAAAERELRGQLVVVGDVFAALPLPARRAAAALLKQLARGGQILHATSDPVFREAADHAP
jgi:hypothetical protein